MRFARVAAVIGVLVLVCVPTLARMGQRLDTSSHTLRFRNIDCPKKVTVAPMQATATVTPIDVVEVAPPASFAPRLDSTLPRSPFLATPRPLRAPPSTFLS